jgi:hypothetical protein
MEQNSTSLLIIGLIAIATALVTPMLPGINAAKNNSLSKELQYYCCSYIEEDDNDSQDLLILNNLPKPNLAS